MRSMGLMANSYVSLVTINVVKVAPDLWPAIVMSADTINNLLMKRNQT